MAPVDLVKNRLQVQSAQTKKASESGAFDLLFISRSHQPPHFNGHSLQVYSGPIDVIVKTVRNDGIRAMFDGYTATVCQRMIGLPFFFVFYDMTQQIAKRYRPFSNFSLSLSLSL